MYNILHTHALTYQIILCALYVKTFNVLMFIIIYKLLLLVVKQLYTTFIGNQMKL